MLSKLQLSKLQEISTSWPDKKPELNPSDSKWFNQHHEVAFKQICREYSDGLYLELGTWTGAGSTRFIADQYPDMTIICIDTFEGSAEHYRTPAYDRVRVKLWDHFVVNQWHNKHRMFPIRTDTITGMKKVAAAGLEPNVVYIDAAHDTESVFQDIYTALECFPKAIIRGDDYTPPGTGHPGVRDGIERAIAEGLFAASEFSRYHRIWYLTRNV